ncbi:tRNA (N6-threonylcarbamoyladenosine(37)-N6)-methyltransferase TrmO [Aliikangiella marina]|uniref:tRNA (N6-threonylcarbamoyladenosine(37)-N6)-methyltransferase TrmO n=1 Tax=Aliikangiella marina TaxID=1712262 RepID=A0A545T9U8_9GAMM|nr:tRNA (N6-threonylcarbamoyladenosine(37)-N6)-methyltransferase TrmO [Aliikangiella marina]TQV73991.1 tRNA (N6-threonylcarbamoyladenosine(37)-N6)-methyltransferase TrmO [Aliikangiella marina]
MHFQFDTIGVVHSPFKQKFAIPRQPGLSNAKASIEMLAPYNDPQALLGIEQFSHLWLSFIFHQNISKGWSPLVRPPRLGGNQKIGVFATRSSFRPNPVGLSVVRFERLRQSDEQLFIDIEGVDLLDQTPIIDIKPYIPYADSLSDATGGFAHDSPSPLLSVIFSAEAQSQLDRFEQRYPDLRKLIDQVLSQDPRPAYKKDKIDNKVYAVSLYDFDIRWQVDNSTCQVLEILKL